MAHGITILRHFIAKIVFLRSSDRQVKKILESRSGRKPLSATGSNLTTI